MGKIAKGINKIYFTMLYGNYCYIFIENFPQKFSPCINRSYIHTFLQSFIKMQKLRVERPTLYPLWEIGGYETHKGVHDRTEQGTRETAISIEKKGFKTSSSRLLTGFCHLQRYLQILGISDLGTCRKCEKQKEFPFHVHTYCPASTEQIRRLGAYCTEPS